MKSPAKPIRYEIGTTLAQTFDVSMKQICCTILSEGGYTPLGYLRSYLNESSINLSSTDYTHVLSLRLKPGFTKNLLKVLYYELIGGGGSTLYVQILRNPILSGATWVDVNSFSQIATGASVTYTGGEVIGSGFVVNSQRFALTDIPDNILVFQGDINGTPDIFTITMKSGGGAGKTVQSSITWQEIV